MRRIFMSFALIFGLVAVINAQVVIKLMDGTVLDNNATVEITEYETADNMESMGLLGTVVNLGTSMNVIGKVTKHEMISGGHFTLCFGQCMMDDVAVSPIVYDLDGEGEFLSLHYAFPVAADGHTGSFTFSCFPESGAPGTELATVNVNFKYKGGGTGLTNIGLGRVMLIQSGNSCTLQYNSNGKRLALEVYNLLGVKVFSSQLPSGSGSYTLPVRLQRGVHIFRITEGGKPAFVQKYLIK
ncbi:T9SS type A sorting domain-containing protein [Porphyromonas loveana]|uniref:T9SS type A sorting domain-containing protein n=1 Tax=Porphyromonas loveana TaxID=1884669 RepID=UPI00359FE0BA